MLPRLPKSIVNEMEKIIKRADKTFLAVFGIWATLTIWMGDISWFALVNAILGIAYIVWQVRRNG